MTAVAPPRLRFVQRIHPGEVSSAASAALLLALMFGLKWYGLIEPPGKANGAGRATTENGWHALTLLRWLMLITILAAAASPVLHLTQREHGSKTETNSVVTVLGMITAVLLTYRVLIDLPSASSVVDQKLGSYLGLLAAWGIALGGYHALRAARARERALGTRSAIAPPPPAS
jgi:hypothetical protein